MSELPTYHPQRALDNPDAYYEGMFQNYPQPRTVGIVGKTLMAGIHPEVSFHNGVSEAEYFSNFDPADPLVLTFTHRGRKRLHDVSAAARAVFGTPYLRDRIEDINVWAAAPYMKHAVIRKLGSVSVVRFEDYAKFGIDLDPEDPEDATRMQAVKAALLEHSVRHLQTPGNKGGSVLAVFPAGTKGGQTLREGIGLVLERLSKGNALPITLVSKSEKTSNYPRKLRITFGESVPVEPGKPFGEYMQALDANMTAAAQPVGG